MYSYSRGSIISFTPKFIGNFHKGMVHATFISLISIWESNTLLIYCFLNNPQFSKSEIPTFLLIQLPIDIFWELSWK